MRWPLLVNLVSSSYALVMLGAAAAPIFARVGKTPHLQRPVVIREN